MKYIFGSSIYFKIILILLFTDNISISQSIVQISLKCFERVNFVYNPLWIELSIQNNSSDTVVIQNNSLQDPESIFHITGMKHGEIETSYKMNQDGNITFIGPHDSFSRFFPIDIFGNTYNVESIFRYLPVDHYTAVVKLLYSLKHSVDEKLLNSVLQFNVIDLDSSKKYLVNKIIEIDRSIPEKERFFKLKEILKDSSFNIFLPLILLSMYHDALSYNTIDETMEDFQKIALSYPDMPESYEFVQSVNIVYWKKSAVNDKNTTLEPYLSQFSKEILSNHKNTFIGKQVLEAHERDFKMIRTKKQNEK